MKDGPTKKVCIYDTTLRDGNQAMGITLSLADKLRIARKIDELGFHYIEGGWPNPTNDLDAAFYREMLKAKLHARIAAFGSTRRPGNTCSKDPFVKALIKTGAPVATIFGKTWDLHVRKVIKTEPGENLAMISETVRYLKKYMDEVIYDAEHFFDGYKSNPQYAISTLRAAMDGGADCLVLCDTNGGMMADEFTAIWQAVLAAVKSPLGVHTHNDAGCAEANSFLAVANGAVMVQGTINGLGERCGNANLCTIVPGLQLKRGLHIVSDKQLSNMSELSVFVSEVANVAHNIRQPYVGEAAFSHKGGAHIDGVLKVQESFEHVRPDTVGNMRRFILSDQAGASALMQKLSSLLPDLDKKDPRVRDLLVRIKNLESEGYQFEAADASFALRAYEMLGTFSEPFVVMGFRVIEEIREDGQTFSEATIKVREGTQIDHTAAEGDGPVNALDNALRKTLCRFFPRLREVKLEDFKVRVLDGKDGTAAKVRVLIESSDGASRWGTIGVSTNIIEASWLALIDSMKYKLLKDSLKKE